MTSAESKAQKSRRRVPRRNFRAPVGTLVAGTYEIERAYQLGEGGMMIDCKDRPLREGQLIVLNFVLPEGTIVMVRGVVRAIIPPKDGHPQRYGLEFVNLEFQAKRAIRNFVAAATSEDGQPVFQNQYY